jgi:hypothetical protein
MNAACSHLVGWQLHLMLRMRSRQVEHKYHEGRKELAEWDADGSSEAEQLAAPSYLFLHPPAHLGTRVRHHEQHDPIILGCSGRLRLGLRPAAASRSPTSSEESRAHFCWTFFSDPLHTPFCLAPRAHLCLTPPAPPPSLPSRLNKNNGRFPVLRNLRTRLLRACAAATSAATSAAARMRDSLLGGSRRPLHRLLGHAAFKHAALPSHP